MSDETVTLPAAPDGVRWVLMPEHMHEHLVRPTTLSVMGAGETGGLRWQWRDSCLGEYRELNAPEPEPLRPGMWIQNPFSGPCFWERTIAGRATLWYLEVSGAQRPQSACTAVSGSRSTRLRTPPSCTSCTATRSVRGATGGVTWDTTQTTKTIAQAVTVSVTSSLKAVKHDRLGLAPSHSRSVLPRRDASGVSDAPNRRRKVYEEAGAVKHEQ